MSLDYAGHIARDPVINGRRKRGHAGYVEDLKRLREAHYRQFLDNGEYRFARVDEVIAAFDAPPPEDFTFPYSLTPEQVAQLEQHRVQRKYVKRFANIRRSWALLLQYLPELMAPGTRPRDVLEMSTAHGATLEILRHNGHTVRGTDFPNFLGRKTAMDSRERGVNDFVPGLHRDDHGFLNDNGEAEGWLYQPITDSLGLDVDLFDAGQVPYPYVNDRFDTVISFDALEHYCHPRDWLFVIDEMVRIARRSVLVVTNPVQEHKLADSRYMEAFHTFQKDMRSYRDGGFECVLAGMYRHQVTVFKLMAA